MECVAAPWEEVFTSRLPVNGAADRLVTFNERHLASAAREFGIRVQLPRETWKEIRRRDEKK
jgi:hypothetical protein